MDDSDFDTEAVSKNILDAVMDVGTSYSEQLAFYHDTVTLFVYLKIILDQPMDELARLDLQGCTNLYLERYPIIGEPQRVALDTLLGIATDLLGPTKDNILQLADYLHKRPR